MIWPAPHYKIVYPTGTCLVRRLPSFSFNEWWPQHADWNDVLVRGTASVWTEILSPFQHSITWNQRRRNSILERESKCRSENRVVFEQRGHSRFHGHLFLFNFIPTQNCSLVLIWSLPSALKNWHSSWIHSSNKYQIYGYFLKYIFLPQYLFTPSDSPITHILDQLTLSHNHQDSVHFLKIFFLYLSVWIVFMTSIQVH